MSEFKIYTEGKVELDLMPKEVINEIREDKIELSHENYFNILIAEFMGGIYYKFREKPTTWYMWRDIECQRDARQHYNLKYHSSWDWLMPVILKIGKMPVDVNDPEVTMNRFYPVTFGMPTDDGTEYMFRFYACQLHMGATVMEAAYSAVVEFIKDYNKISGK